MFDERAEFRAGVAAACSDLSEPQRAKVLAALDAWWEERSVAESGTGVALALGDAETYAAELRSAMGLPERAAAARRGERIGSVPRWVLPVVVVALLVAASLATWAITQTNGSTAPHPIVPSSAPAPSPTLPPKVTMPLLLHMKTHQATRRLREAGLHWQIRFIHAVGFPSGVVVAQGGVPGTGPIRVGSTIILKVSR